MGWAGFPQENDQLIMASNPSGSPNARSFRPLQQDNRDDNPYPPRCAGPSAQRQPSKTQTLRKAAPRAVFGALCSTGLMTAGRVHHLEPSSDARAARREAVSSLTAPARRRCEELLGRRASQQSDNRHVCRFRCRLALVTGAAARSRPWSCVVAPPPVRGRDGVA
jgi:hypothetical protein